MNRRHAGFTLIELLIIVSILGLFAAMSLPRFVDSRDAAREDEVKANITSIRIALERYGLDHNGNYPMYILGGDAQGWDMSSGCESVALAAAGRTLRVGQVPQDPLISWGYIDSYPSNPFVTGPSEATVILAATGAIEGETYGVTGDLAQSGLGDPRFGFNGDRMGNCLDDPRYLWRAFDQPTSLADTIERNKTHRHGVLAEDRAINPLYSMGGLPLGDIQPDWSATASETQINAWWPGQFCYRAGGAFIFPQSFTLNVATKQPTTLWDFHYILINSYLLAGYGALTSPGSDLIRLTALNTGKPANNLNGWDSDAGFYRPHPDFPATGEYSGTDGLQGIVHCSTPEVFGGGNRKNNPFYPPLGPHSLDWIYGAPDGYPDGIIMLVTDLPN